MTENLEDKINSKESKGFFRKGFKLAWKLGFAAASTALVLSTAGTSGLIIGGAVGAGHLIGGLIKGKPLYDVINESLTAYSAVNTILSPMIALGDATFPLIPNDTFIGKAMRGIYATTLYNAVFVSAYKGTSHLIDNYLNPIGITNSIKDNFFKTWLGFGIGMAPAYTLVANGITQLPFGYFGLEKIPSFAANVFPYMIYRQLRPFSPAKKSSPTYNPVPKPEPQYQPSPQPIGQPAPA